MTVSGNGYFPSLTQEALSLDGPCFDFGEWRGNTYFQHRAPFPMCLCVSSEYQEPYETVKQIIETVEANTPGEPVTFGLPYMDHMGWPVQDVIDQGYLVNPDFRLYIELLVGPGRWEWHEAPTPKVPCWLVYLVDLVPVAVVMPIRRWEDAT